MKSTAGFDYRHGAPVLLTTAQWHETVRGLRHVVIGNETMFYDHNGALCFEMYGRLNVYKGERAKVPTMPVGIEIVEEGNPWD